jgi:hypothetical protein
LQPNSIERSRELDRHASRVDLDERFPSMPWSSPSILAPNRSERTPVDGASSGLVAAGPQPKPSRRSRALLVVPKGPPEFKIGCRRFQHSCCMKARSLIYRFAGSERAYVVPSSTHVASWRLVRTSFGSTRSHPCMRRPRISMRRALVVARSLSDCAGSTRTKTPPWPLAAMAMLPPMRKASPPNIFFSVRSDSLPIRSRMRSASFSSYATAVIVRQPADRGGQGARLTREPVLRVIRGFGRGS